MNGKKLMSAIGAISEKYILEACEYSKEKSNPKSNVGYRMLKRVITVAASIIIALFIPVTVYAAVNKTSIPEAVEEIYREYIVVRFEKKDEAASRYQLLETELVEQLKENGVYPVLLPEALFGKNCEIENVICKSNSDINKAEISFAYENQKGVMVIISHSSADFIEETTYPASENATVLEISGISVSVFENNGKSMIVFKDGLTEYTVTSQMSLEQSIVFAETVK